MSKYSTSHHNEIKSNTRISDYYCMNTFSETSMKTLVTQKTFRSFKKWQNKGKVISSTQADEIANAMNMTKKIIFRVTFVEILFRISGSNESNKWNGKLNTT